ncbi:MAG TPA: hypothetical protein VIN04_15900 [Myxococcota bacterium]
MAEPEAASARDLAERVCALALALGFDRAGIARLDGPLPHGDALRDWLARGRHGAMAWMARDPEHRIDPRLRFPWARSAVVVSLVYDSERAGVPESATTRSSAQGGRPASGAAEGRGARSLQASGASAQRGVAERSSSGWEASEAHQAVAEAWHADRVDGLEGQRPDAAANQRPRSGAPANLDARSTASPRSAAEQRRLAKERRRTVEKATRELARLEARIAEREKALEELAWRLGDPAVLRDGERARALDAERAGLRAEIDALYGEWESWAAALDEAGSEASG